MKITLRNVEPDDDAFLFAAYASSRAQEMAMVPWTDEQRTAFLRSQFNAQQGDYNKRFADAQHGVILADGMPAGISRLQETDSEITIIDLIVMPEYRRQGIGTYLLGDYCAMAKTAGKPLRVYVETFNPSLQLFERLGFSRVADDGVYHLLEWDDPSDEASPLQNGEA